jgi:hypothetical protein
MKGDPMRVLRFLAFAPLALGFVILVFTLIWTEWFGLVFVVGLFAVAAGIWRAFSGSWPLPNQLPS